MPSSITYLRKHNPRLAPIESWPVRLIYGIIAFGCVALLWVAHGLQADPSGLGTHRGLGLPPCGFLMGTGLPCATCGMTTSFAHAAHGHLIQAFITQPAGASLCLLTTMAMFCCSYAAVSGFRLRYFIAPFWKPLNLALFSIWILLAWGYKIALVTWLIG